MSRRFGTKLSTNNIRNHTGAHKNSKLFQAVSKGLSQQPLQLKSTTTAAAAATKSTKSTKKSITKKKAAAMTTPAKVCLELPVSIPQAPQSPQAPQAPQAPHAPQAPQATQATGTTGAAPSTAKKIKNTTRNMVAQTPLSAAAVKPPSTAVKKFNQSVQHAKKLIVEAKIHAKSTETADWTRAVALYTEASDLLPERIAAKLQMKIQHLQERIAGAEDDQLVKQHIQRAKQFIVKAKTKSKSLHAEEWVSAIELYAQARDLLPPHLGNKLSKKINSLTAKIAAAKMEDSDDSEEDEEDVDLFSDAMFDLTDIFAWKKTAEEEEQKAKEKEIVEEQEEEEEDEEMLNIPMVGKTPMKQAPALVFDRFGSVGAEVFALALGRSIDLRVTTRYADDLLDMLRAVDACETEILGTSDHALKTSWRKVANRSRKRVHFCTFDLSTISPPDKWSDISDKKEKKMSTNPQEKLTYHLCDVLTTARELLEDQEEDGALSKFLNGLREVADDTTVTAILRKGAEFFHHEFHKLKDGVVPFVDRFDKAATSSMRYHLRCLFNTKPDSITAKPVTKQDLEKLEKKTNSSSNNDNDEDNSDDDDDDDDDEDMDDEEEEKDEDSASDEDEAQSIAIDSDGSYGYCGREDMAAIVHRALRERVGVTDGEEEDSSGEEDVDGKLVAMEASRFLYELLTHPGTILTKTDKASTWESMRELSEKIASLSDICSSFSLQATTPMAADPEKFVAELMATASSSSKAEYDRLTTLDSLAYSRYIAISTLSKKKKKKKLVKKKSQNQQEVMDSYIVEKAPFRFKYPRLNHRGQTDVLFGSVRSEVRDVMTKSWNELSLSLISKIMKCRRKNLGGKVGRYFLKGLTALKKDLKEDTIEDASSFATLFQTVIQKNEKVKGSTKQRNDCRTFITELFNHVYEKDIVKAEETQELNRCRCEFCAEDCSGEKNNTIGIDIFQCDTCTRLVHKQCIANVVQNDVALTDIATYYCRECTNDALNELKHKAETA